MGLNGGHFLQSWQWGQVKSRYGWAPLHQTWSNEAGKVDAAALILKRSLSFGRVHLPLSVLYVPRGPLLNWQDAACRSRVLDALQGQARRSGSIFIKIDPEVPVGWGVPGTPEAVEDSLGSQVQQELVKRGWYLSPDQIQFRNTVWVDLKADEETLLARMKQKTRYNIRLAQRKGVTVRLGTEADYPALYRLYAETSVRDGFVIRSEEYYRNVWQTFGGAGFMDFLIAEIEGEMAAALVLVHSGTKAWYFYGMSSEKYRPAMPTYLLQWEAMRQARQAGCETYDLWGAPDVFSEEDSMWGVYRFKEGFNGQVIRTLGAWDYPVQPVLYQLYTRWLPRLLDQLRRRGKEQTRQIVAQ